MQTHANSRRLFHLLAPLLLLILLTLSQIGSVKSAYAATASTVSAHHTLSPAVGPPDATWTWVSSNHTLQAWLSSLENDSVSGYHYNFHVQPYNGSTDYHNYHIAYIGTGGTDYRWQIKDSIKNTCRTYDESWNVYLSDATYYALAAFSVDVSNDTGSTELENAMNNQGSKAFQNAFAELYYV